MSTLVQSYLPGRTELRRSSAVLVLAALGLLGLLVAGVTIQYNAAIAILVTIGFALALATLYDPYWGATVLVVVLTVIPVERTYNSFLGHNIGNPLQIIMPVLLGLCLLRALKSRELPKPIWPDLLVIGLGVAGLISLFFTGHLAWEWKKYGNKILYPMGLYYLVRLVPLDHRKLVRLIKIGLAVVALQGIVMIVQDRAGSSPIYSTHGGRATGPFGHFWTAAAYMVMWPSLFIYMGSSATSSWGRGLSFLGLLVNAYAITRTDQRAATALLLVVAGVCLLAPRTRSAAIKALIIGALAYIPWSMTAAGSDLLDRFDETDESRVAYREAAFATLRSSRWHPLFGVGPYQGDSAMTHIDTSQLENRRVLMWGSRERSVAEVAEEGAALHNVYIALLLEFGTVGAMLALALAISLLKSMLRIYTQGNHDGRIDRGLIVAVLGALVAWGGIGYVHNVYSFTAPMALMFFWYGVVVGHPQAFVRSRPAEPVADQHVDRAERVK
ncbi:MAG: hypothetical protein U9R79_03550 [Armatimonadota bacterium]|nr:hypothetical protein [Armatimonadota bacterium]